MNFSQFGFKDFINNRLAELQFVTPTAIQEKVIPLMQAHRNVVVQAPTGTGKTHAFLLPLIDNLDPQKPQQVQLIIFTPTQELAQQLVANVKFLINDTNFRVALYTKDDHPTSKRSPTIVIGSPERLRYLFDNQEVKLTTAHAIVVDEVDMIFSVGFIENLDFLMAKMAKDVQIGFFSATINPALKQYFKKYLSNSVLVDIKPHHQSLITHYYVDLGTSSPLIALGTVVQNLNPYLALIFVNHKHEIKGVRERLEKLNLGPVTELHADLDSRTRTRTLKRINSGEFKYVVVSDVVARGLDIPGVSHVISLGLPANLDFYWHRSGRTGRYQVPGKSYILANTRDLNALKILEKKGAKLVRLKLTRDHNLVTSSRREAVNHYQKILSNPELDKLLGQLAKKKPKPNYQKKRKQAIANLVKQQRRRAAITAMRRHKKSKAKRRRSALFD